MKLFGKRSRMILEFISVLASGKKCLFITPKYVIMDYNSWVNLHEKKKEELKIECFDELSYFSDSEFETLKDLLTKIDCQ